MTRNLGYNGNIRLRKAFTQIAMSQHERDEYEKCMNDSIYFIRNYVKIVALGKGIVPFDLYPFQENMVRTFENNRFIIAKMPRQVGKCVFKETYIVVRDKNNPESLLKTTIGNLYESQKTNHSGGSTSQRENTINFYRNEQEEILESERGNRLRNVRSLRNDGNGSDISFESSQNFSKRIHENKQAPIGIFSETAIRKTQGRQESREKSWWKIISILDKIFEDRTRSRSHETKSDAIEDRQQFGYNATDILAREDEWKFGKSEKAALRKAINIFFREVYSEAWSGTWNRSLESSPRKMAKVSDVEYTRRNCAIQQTKSDKFWSNFESGERNIRDSSIGISECGETTHDGFGRKSNLPVRYVFDNREEDNRVQWRLLARESKKIFERLLSSTDKVDGRGNLGKRSEKDPIRGKLGFQSFDYLGDGLQNESDPMHSGMSRLSDTIERKFIDSIDLDNIEVMTDSGWQGASKIHKTVVYDEWILETENHNLICADTHIVFRENGDEVFVESLKVGDRIQTETGIETVISVTKTDSSSHMFDMTIDSNDHRFYTNGILSHNSITTVAYLLHTILFNENYSLAILAHKGSAANGLLQRLKLAYENIPTWLQSGIIEWNKGNIELENGSKIGAFATSADGLRSGSFDCVTGDAIVTIRKNDKIYQTNIADLFEDANSYNNIEVLSQGGFKRFCGVRRIDTTKQLIQFEFKNGNHLKCTDDHLIMTDSGWKKASECLDDRIATIDGYTTIESKIEIPPEYVYDLLEVEDSHSFYANDILVHNCILLDEFAFVPNNIAEAFFTSTYPVISSGTDTKIIIVSTPKGMNHFFTLWTKAVTGKSNYVPLEIHWSAVPGRDEAWKKQTIENTSEEQFKQEFESSSYNSYIYLEGKRIAIGELYEQLEKERFENDYEG